MSDEENAERETDQGERGDVSGHPFDQTNGMVDGLAGDADTPEQADKRTGNGDGAAFLAAPSPGSQMAAGIMPAVADEAADETDPDAGADADADDPTPA